MADPQALAAALRGAENTQVAGDPAGPSLLAAALANRQAWNASGNNPAAGLLGQYVDWQKNRDFAGELSNPMFWRNMAASFAAPIKSTGASLDMSLAAQAQRAADQGYTVDAYHGSKGDIRSFDPAYLGAATNAPSSRQAFFFTSKPSVAETYAVEAPDPALVMQKQEAFRAGQAASNLGNAMWDKGDALHAQKGSMPADEFERLWAAHAAEHRAAHTALDDAMRRENQLQSAISQSKGSETGATLYPVKLRMENPAVHDYTGKDYRDLSFAQAIRDAKAAGHDSVVFNNVYDAWKMYGGDPYRSDVYAVFDPAQVRSRFAAFDPSRINSRDLLAGGAPLLAGSVAAGSRATQGEAP